MLFWIVTVALTLAVSAVLALALMRAQADARPPAAYDLNVYRDQLKEVDRDLARGIVSDADAERARTEVSRRILAADAALRRDSAVTGKSGSVVLSGIILVTVAAIAYASYLQLGAPGYGDLALADRIEQAEILRAERPGQSVAEASLPNMPPPADASPEYVALVQQLRAAIKDRPDDLQGYILLTQSEARLGNFAAAHAAKAKVIELKGTAATADDYSAYTDLLVLAAGGYVSPEAEQMLQRTLSLEPGNGTARYYFGLMMAQTGRPDMALRVWDQLLREGPPDAPWIAVINPQIADLAMLAGVNNYERPQATAVRGPSADDIDAAGAMTPAERMDMIQGMVSGLSDRLANQGGPPEEWAQLISALGVLGQMDQASAIFANAKEVFGQDPGAMDIINQAADRAGLQ